MRRNAHDLAFPQEVLRVFRILREIERHLVAPVMGTVRDRIPCPAENRNALNQIILSVARIVVEIREKNSLDRIRVQRVSVQVVEQTVRAVGRGNDHHHPLVLASLHFLPHVPLVQALR